jgi:hypothetical protein
MAYSRQLAQRLEILLADLAPVRKEMFGGVGYLLHGNMVCGVIGEDLILRVGPEKYESMMAHPQARPFDMTGRPMRGWVVILPAGVQTDMELHSLVDQALAFNATLPPK